MKKQIRKEVRTFSANYPNSLHRWFFVLKFMNHDINDMRLTHTFTLGKNICQQNICLKVKCSWNGVILKVQNSETVNNELQEPLKFM